MHQKTKKQNQTADPFQEEFMPSFKKDSQKICRKNWGSIKIFALGTDLKHMKMTWRILSKLDELNEILSKLSQEEGKKLIWALKPAMLALIQPKFLGEHCEGVTLPVAACLCNIMKLTTPIEIGRAHV